ncbi:MrcB family domain-containing protein [Paenibacillus glucanolyticus]|uniref:MrcB family domain-containing protein n=1 Tax=Paenibacillus glucanolyticus TaxID=59843 RepID=UPI003678BAE2
MLPNKLSSIFRTKQKSYKMVLILSLIEHYQQTHLLYFPLSTIAERFLSYFQENSKQCNKVDSPPPGKASHWDDFTLPQTMSLLKTPLEALSAILEVDQNQQTVTFRPDIADKLDDHVLRELKEYALTELQNYNDKLGKPAFSLQNALFEIMNSYIAARNQAFAGHPLGALFRQAVPEHIRSLSFIDPNYKIQGSVGQGNWANIPWIAVMDKRITDTTQHGEYIVYLFSEDMESVYLTVAQGVTVPKEELGKKEGYHYLEQKANELRELLPLEGMQKDESINLTSRSGLGRDYQVSTVAYLRYDRDAIPDDDQLLADLENVVSNYKMYVDHVIKNKGVNEEVPSKEEKESPSLNSLTVPEQIDQIQSYISHKGFHYPHGLIENLYLSLKTKPFVILAGVSGTGKTKLVKLFAEALGATGQFTLIPVRPDWSDPSDLLGYKDLSGVFRPGRLAEVLVEASQRENQHKPYFVCLDEMNLARVEYYFSDVLSVIETQEWKQDRIVTSKLMNRESLLQEDQSIYGDLSIPDNVYLIGTVNMDETTHPFSKKVLDRANTIEFNYIDLQQYPSLGLQETESILPVHNSFLRSEYLQLVDVYSEYTELVHATTEKLVKINHILEEIHSHVGFRIRDSICFYMVYNQRHELLTNDEAFDLQLLQKILPRVQGSSLSVKRVLLKLLQGALGRNLPVSELMDDASEIYLKWNDNEEESKAKHPLSARKIAFMLRRLEEDGFTSYWLS